MKKYRRSRWKDFFYYSSRTKRFVLVFVLLLFVFSITSGFSLLSKALGIGTNVEIRPDRDIRITSVEGPILANGAYENGNYQYSHDLLISKGVLPNSNSTIAYRIEITNNGNTDKTLDSITDEINGDAIYSVEGIEIGDEVLMGETKVVTVIFHNPGSSSVTYSGEIQFHFSNSYVDITAPTITFDPMPDSEWTKDDKTVLLSATDDRTIVSFQYCTTTSNSCTPDIDADIDGTTITLSNDGKHVICATATDNAKKPNTSTVCTNEEGEYYQIDKTAPTISSLVSSNTWGKTNTVTAKVSDSQSGLVGYAFTTSNTQPSTFTSVTNTTAEQTYTYTATANGTVYFWAKDRVGHVSSKSVSVTKVDTIPPVITVSGHTSDFSISTYVREEGEEEWLTEEELAAVGKSPTDPGIKSKTQYGYQDVASWSSSYSTTAPSDGYYKTKTQYNLTYTTGSYGTPETGTLKSGSSTSFASGSPQSGCNESSVTHAALSKTTLSLGGTYKIIKVTASSTTRFSASYSSAQQICVCAGSSCQSYSGVTNPNTDGTISTTFTFAATGVTSVNCYGYGSTNVSKKTISCSVTEWAPYNTTTKTTGWQDSNTTDKGTVISTQTRTVYAPPASWKSATGWRDSEAYTKTTSRKPVTRTVYHDTTTSYHIPIGTATDNSGEDITVITSGNVVPTVVGSYPITYTATDPAGNTTKLVMTVHVIERTYSDWLTESELAEAGYSPTSEGVQSKTQYRLTYTTTTRTTKTGSLWSTTYQPTGIVWQLALDTGTQTAIYPRTIRWRVKTVSQDSEDGKRVNATNTLKVQGTDGTVKSFPQTYNFVENAGFDLTWTATLDGTFEANRIYLESFWWKYNKKSMASVVVTSWDEVTTTTGVTDWQDSNTTSAGTVTKTETRTVYRYQTN